MRDENSTTGKNLEAISSEQLPSQEAEPGEESVKSWCDRCGKIACVMKKIDGITRILENWDGQRKASRFWLRVAITSFVSLLVLFGKMAWDNMSDRNFMRETVRELREDVRILRSTKHGVVESQYVNAPNL